MAETAGPRSVTLEQFRAELQSQGVISREDLAMKCPICGTVQSARSLFRAGLGGTFEDAEGFLGFSCVGRFTGAGAYSQKTKSSPEGCDWTLGGLFKLHKLEVETPDGRRHPRFEPATPEEAQALAREHARAIPNG